MGRLRAQTLDAPLRAIVVRHPDDPATPGGTTSNLALWREIGIAVTRSGLRSRARRRARRPNPR
jgi:hypothetical protein